MVRDYLGHELKIGDIVAIAGKVPGNYGYNPPKMFVGIVKKITNSGIVKCKVSKYGKLYDVKYHGNVLIINKNEILEHCSWLNN